MKKLLITSLFFAALVACNSSTQEGSEANESTEKMNLLLQIRVMIQIEEKGNLQALM